MKQIKLINILKKDVVSSLNNCYDFKDSFLIKQPLQDIVVGFCFERSSEKDEKYVWFFSMPLYFPNDVFSLTFGNRIKGDNGQLWDFNDGQIDNTIKKLLPKLLSYEKKINELEIPHNFYNEYYRDRQKNLRIYEAVTYTACWLGLPTIHNEIEQCIKFIENENDISIVWVKKILDNMKLLQIQKSGHEILNLLSEWKTNTLKELKL